MKRILFAIFWIIIFYFGACAITGGIAGGIAGGNDPANAYAAGGEAGTKAVLAIRAYLLIGAIVLGIVGAWLRWLPGTRLKQSDDAKAAESV